MTQNAIEAILMVDIEITKWPKVLEGRKYPE